MMPTRLFRRLAAPGSPALTPPLGWNSWNTFGCNISETLCCARSMTRSACVLHAERGVHLRLGTGVAGLTRRRGRVAGVRLDTGEELPADVVAVAVELLR